MLGTLKHLYTVERVNYDINTRSGRIILIKDLGYLGYGLW